MVETIISLYNKINILLSNKRCEFEFCLHQNQFFDVCNKIKTSNPIISIKKKNSLVTDGRRRAILKVI